MTIHAHKILNMMAGNSYTQSSLVEAIHAQFGADATFKTCSTSGMNAEQIIEVLQGKGKFKPTQEGQFTLNKVCGCNHDEDGHEHAHAHDHDEEEHGGCCGHRH